MSYGGGGGAGPLFADHNVGINDFEPLPIDYSQPIRVVNGNVVVDRICLPTSAHMVPNAPIIRVGEDDSLVTVGLMVQPGRYIDVQVVCPTDLVDALPPMTKSLVYCTWEVAVPDMQHVAGFKLVSVEFGCLPLRVHSTEGAS